MLALAGRRGHLEFTRYARGSPCPAPTKDNLLVFYVEEDGGAIREMNARLHRQGHEPVHAPVEPENPYWAENVLTFEDPDGWRVVLMHSSAGI